MIKTDGRMILGIIGRSLKQSLSPAIHAYFFKKLGLDGSYVKFEADNDSLADTITRVKTLGIQGVNVTYPCKEAVIPYLDRLDRKAQMIKAVNTIKNVRGKLIGYNTDLCGIESTLRDRLKIRLKGKTAVMLGAGGAARACLSVLVEQKPARVIIFNRTVENAEKIVALYTDGKDAPIFEVKNFSDVDSLKNEADVVIFVNAVSAPASMAGKIISALTAGSLLNSTAIFDMNYGKRALSGKQLAGARSYEDGLYMLCVQAAESFRIWTGRKPDPNAVFKQMTRKLKG